jgi:hypothetical protein
MKGKLTEGTRVHVFTPHRKEYLGKATIEKVEEIDIAGMGTTLYPSRIVLDNGEVTEGIGCWWMKIT